MRGTKAKRMRKFYGEHRDKRRYHNYTGSRIAVGERRAYQAAKKLVG